MAEGARPESQRVEDAREPAVEDDWVGLAWGGLAWEEPDDSLGSVLVAVPDRR